MMRVFVVLLVVWGVFPGRLEAAEEPSRMVLHDEAAGYLLPLPAGWREVTGSGELEELVRRVAAVFLCVDGTVPGARHLRGAFLPDGGRAAPALVVFSLEYAGLGLSREAVQAIAKDARTATAGLANGIQESFMHRYPQSILVNKELGDDFFSLSVRSVGDFADEEGTTRNQHLKVMLTAGGALVLAALYEGPPDAGYDTALGGAVRELMVLPEKSLQRVNPPAGVGFLDYLMIAAAIVFAVILVGKVRRFMR